MFVFFFSFFNKSYSYWAIQISPNLKHFSQRPKKQSSPRGNPGRAGVGGVIRDVNGAWVRGFSGAIGLATNVQAELWELKVGLDMGITAIECQSESDSRVAVDLVLEPLNLCYIYI